VLITGTGGVANYNLQLGAATQNGVASYNFTGLGGGSYTVNVTDATGCTATGSVTLNSVSVPDPTFTYNGNQCFTGHSYNFTHTGTVIGGETYAWTFAGGTPASSAAHNPSGVTWAAPGTYTVTLQITAGGCVQSSSQNITVYGQPTPTITPTAASCGLCNGSASTTVAYSSYSWTGGGTTQTINALCTGPYSVTVTDANSCTGSASTVITNSGNIPTASVVTTPPTCAGGCNGTATVNAIGCATYSYNYSSGTTPNNQSTGGLCAGAYTVTVADGSNAACSTVENFSIVAPPAMVLTMSSVNSVCGMANGTASVVVSGHTPPPSYNWSNGAITSVITAAAGSYTVTVTDGAGCTASNSVNIIDAGVPFSITTSVVSQITCNGLCNGSATVTPLGAGPFTYLWDNTQITQTSTGLCVGAHTVSVTMAGCTVVGNVNITQPTALTTTTINPVSAHCGLSDGAITANPSGGTAPYVSHVWNSAPVQNAVTATGLPSGNYTVTVTDNLGCTASATGFVPNIAGQTVTVTGTNVSCAGGANGTATATVVGGSPNYTYNWSNGFNQTIPGLISNVGGLNAGAISVVVTDNFGCTATHSVTLTQPSAVSVNLVSTIPVTCNGDCDGEAQISVSGGTAPYSYVWSSGLNPNSNNNINLCGGAHSVVVTDNNGCTASLNFNIVEPAAMLLNMSTTTANCGNANGTATATPVGGTGPYLWSWSAGGNTASMTNTNLNSAGNPYNVTVTDANGCSQTGTASIVDIPGPTAVISAFGDVGCNGNNDGWATVSAAGGTAPYTYTWSTIPVQTNTTAINLAPGVYHVTVQDITTCTITATAIIGQPAGLSLNIVAPQIFCYGGCNGNALANVAGGTFPYTFLWSDLQLTQTAMNLCAGPVSVTVTDDNGCSISSNTMMTEGPAIIVTEVITPSNCSQSDGSIDVTVGGGSPPYSYAWSSGQLSQDIWNVPAGAYTLTITDNKGCQEIRSYPISDQNAQIATISATSNATCNGTCNGTATVNVSGGSGLFTYSWNSVPVQSSSTATNLCDGAYNVVVTDLTTGCIAAAGTTITEPPLLDLISAITNVTCSGLCNGAINITTFGGTTPYSYTWSGPGVTINSEDQSNRCAGAYSVIVLDVNNCFLTRNFTITAPSFITVPMVSTATACSGSCTGTATAAPSGGTAPYTYLWSGSGQTTATALSLCTGNHTVTVTDANGCTGTNTVFVSTPTPMQFADVTVNDAQCDGSSNADISVTVIGGTPPYDYVWDNGQTISTPFGLSAGQHCVTVLDNNGCMINTCAMVNDPPALNVTLTATNELCNGACNGTITSMPSGGVGPYSYLWSNSEVASSISNLCAGVYNITLTDFNGCQAYNSTSINSPAILGINVQNITQPTCGNADGSVTVGATGGVGPFTYAWLPVPASGGASSTINSIQSGNYTVTITDFNGCSISQTIGVSDINGPIISSIVGTNVNCYGEATGTAEVFFTSSTITNTIAWSNFQSTALAINLVEGAYTVTITDNNGCSAVGNIAITEPLPFTASIVSFDGMTCAGICNGTATGAGFGGTLPYIYSWSNGASTATANNLCFGNYDLTITDDNGCTATTSTFIDEPTPLTLSGTVVHTQCYAGNDGIVTVTAGGGTGSYFYSWPQIGANTPVIDGLTAAAYTVVVYDASDIGCFISDTYIVGEPAPIDAIFATENATCGFDNGVAYVDNIVGGTGSYVYVWNPGSMTGSYQDNLAPGTYSVVITDGNSCTAQYSVTVDATSSLQIDNVMFNGVTCFGDNDGFAQVFVSGGLAPYIYNWTPNVTDQAFSNSLFAGVYNVNVEDQDGCIVYTQFPISTPEQVLAFPGESITICIGQQAIVTASASGGVPGYGYTWSGLGSGSSFLVSPIVTTDYTVIATDSRGCQSAPANQLIEVNLPLSLVVITPSAICEGQVSTLVANVTGGDGNYVYDWGNGQVTTSNTLNISPIVSTDYTVIVSDGCTTPRDTVTITAAVSAMPEVHIIRTPYTGCSPLLVDFDNNTDNMTYSYYWEFDDMESGTNNYSDLKRPTHTFEATGVYDVLAVVSTSMGCKDSADIQVVVHDGPLAEFNAFPWSTGLFEPEIDFVDASVGAIAWEWSFGDGGTSGGQNPTHTYLEQGEFPVTLTVYSQQGCLDTVTKNIEIIDDHRIYFPTAINLRSPGNDEFYPIGVGVDEESYRMTIYNRWGELIFTTNDWYTHWKGRYEMDKGDYVPQGVYTYVVVLRDKYGKDYTYAGSVTVFK
jgi:PKD repeat protein